MARFIRPFAAALAFCCLAPTPALFAPAVAFAQAQAQPSPEPLNQIALTDAQIQAYIAAAADIEPLLEKAPQSNSGQPDAKTISQLDAAAKKYQFASFEAFQDVAENIGLVMDGVDPQTKKYVGADVELKKQIAEVQADPKMAAADKKQALAELNEALKAIEPVKNAGNIELVVKYYDKLAAAQPSQD